MASGRGEAPLVVLLGDEDFAHEEERFHSIGVNVLVGGAQAPAHAPALGIASLAGPLLEAGFRCELVDNFRTVARNGRRAEELLARGPLLVGLSTTFIFTERAVRETAELVRRLSPRSHFVLGGPSLLQNAALRRHADIAVLGEGEKTLPLIAARLRDGGDLADVPGIEFERDGRRVATAPAPLVAPEDVPFPRWDLLDHGPHAVYPLETQRGCVYKCRYCTYPVYSPGRPDGGGLRLWPVERVVAEVRRNHERHGILNYRLADSTFTFPVARAEEVCRALLETGLPLRWSCYGRVDNMTPSLAGLMARSGCRAVFFGVESGDPGMLAAMRKDFTLEDVHRGVAVTRAAGMKAVGSFIVGYPGETARTVDATRRCIKEAGFDMFRVSTFWYDHNAPLDVDAARLGLTGEGGVWRHATMDSQEAEAATRGLIRDVMVANASRYGSDYVTALVAQYGVDYDDALQYLLDLGLLRNLKRAREEKAPLDAFDDASLREAVLRANTVAQRVRDARRVTSR